MHLTAKNALLAVILICSLAVLGCQRAVQHNADLVICSPHPLEFITPIVENFENETGLDVQVIQAGSGEILNTLLMHPDSFYCDILWGGSYATVLPALVLFQNYQSIHENQIQDAYKNVEGPITRFSDIPSVLMINKKIAGSIVIEGYEDLLKPELKGKIAFCDPAVSASAWEHLINMLFAMGGGDTPAAWAFVAKFCSNLDGGLLTSSAQVYRGVFEGKFAVGLTFEEGGAKYAKTDDSIKLVYMKEGVVSTPDGVYISKKAKNLKNAQLFIDYATGKEVQTYMVKNLTRRSVRKDLEIKSSLLPKESMKIITVDYNYVAGVKNIWLDKFKAIWDEGKHEKTTAF